jgi:hypothetical protein
MEVRGCAAVRGSSAVELELDQRWTHDEVTEFLKNLLPLPFAYAYKHLKHARRSNRNSVPIWILLNKEKGYLDVVPNERPNGADLFRFRGRIGVSIAEAQIFLSQSSAPLQIRILSPATALRDPIPDAICVSWDPKYHAATPDANDDGNDDEGSIADDAVDEDDGSWADDGGSAAKDDSDESIVGTPPSKWKGKEPEALPGTSAPLSIVPMTDLRGGILVIMTCKRKLEASFDQTGPALKKHKDVHSNAGKPILC